MGLGDRGPRNGTPAPECNHGQTLEGLGNGPPKRRPAPRRNHDLGGGHKGHPYATVQAVGSGAANRHPASKRNQCRLALTKSARPNNR